MRFAYVYIAEAHTIDEWPMPIGNEECRHMQPKTLVEKKAHAEEFRQKLIAVGGDESEVDSDLPIFVDSLRNSFMHLFAPWPERFYVCSRNEGMPYVAPPAIIVDNSDNTEKVVPRQTSYKLDYLSQPTSDNGHCIVDLRVHLQDSILKDYVHNPPSHKQTKEEIAQFGPVPNVGSTHRNTPSNYLPVSIFEGI